jgi:hypothetical protein
VGTQLRLEGGSRDRKAPPEEILAGRTKIETISSYKETEPGDRKATVESDASRMAKARFRSSIFAMTSSVVRPEMPDPDVGAASRTVTRLAKPWLCATNAGEVEPSKTLGSPIYSTV